MLENGTTKHYYTSPFFGNKSPIVNGQIITFIGLLGSTAKELQACDKAPPTAFLNGSIAVVAPYGGCSIEKHIVVAQNAGAVAVLVIADPLWKTCRTTDAYHHNNTIPAMCISGDDFTNLIGIIIANGEKNPPQATIAIFNADPNEYDTKLNHRLMNFGTITFFILYVIGGILSIIRFYQFIKVEGWEVTLPKILLGMNIYSAFCSAIIVIDLHGYRGWYVTMQYQVTYFFWIGTAGTYQYMLFTGYIANILVRFSPHKKFFEKLNYAIIGALMLTYIVSIIVFSVYGYSWNFNAAIGNAITVIVAVILGTTAIFFLFSATILITRLATFIGGMKSEKRDQKKRKYLFLSIMLFLAFIIDCLGFSITVAITSKRVQNNIQIYMAVYMVLNISALGWVYIILSVFNTRDHSKKASATSSQFKKSDEMNKSFNGDSQSSKPNKSYVEMN